MEGAAGCRGMPLGDYFIPGVQISLRDIVPRMVTLAEADVTMVGGPGAHDDVLGDHTSLQDERREGLNGGTIPG